MGNWKKILDIKDFFINNHGNVYHKINLLNIRQTVHGVAQIEMYALQFAHACDWKKNSSISRYKKYLFKRHHKS